MLMCCFFVVVVVVALPSPTIKKGKNSDIQPCFKCSTRLPKLRKIAMKKKSDFEIALAHRHFLFNRHASAAAEEADLSCRQLVLHRLCCSEMFEDKQAN